ncbi:MAG: hypothetical protein A2493_01980 [Candidatus Magasanikbacteria bacterium RIFOXYC12_FULL_33_11]|uniref:Uncharacterized protein n=1 Tax=Candidatus Magasanikbacteria bacterium RIFOXYC12_FULL_33_11 TaxID=1798701 RepID=A0A1F6NNU4_9BACT|nr:MAG: hypothetical protein A2493_01980 [Candidatus Magasanikbacteria bacterium RIFOXYC12_FULL_33_11]
MKIKIFIISTLLFFVAVPCLAYDFEENFESYADGYAMDNEADWTCSNWVIETEEVLSVSVPNSLWKPNGINNDLTLNLDGKATYGSFQNRNHGVSPIGYKYFDMASSETVESFKITHQITPSLRIILQTNYGSTYFTAETGYDYKHFEWESDGTNVRMRYQNGAWSNWIQMNYGLPNKLYIDIPDGYATHMFYDDVVFNYVLEGLHITSPEMNEAVIDDTWITVEGVCPTNGTNRIGFTNDCLGFDGIQYTTACVDGAFSAEFYKSGLSDRIIAREIDSVSGDCVDYDDLMDFIEVDGFEVIEGYPDDWYFNFDYYDDYDIRIKSPSFDTALTLPSGSTSADFTFGFVYPTEQLANLNFNIKQYDSDGNLLNGSYYNEDLADMTDTWNHVVNLTASSTQGIHYVVQLSESGEMKRQFPFGIYVSDLDFVYNPDDYDYFFPRLVDELKQKIIFNYYFAFHDGFYDMFNGTYSKASDDALDITFKSVSGDGEYNMDVKIFSASDSRVKTFTSGLRPYIVALLWLVFALYVVFRITHLFSDNE